MAGIAGMVGDGGRVQVDRMLSKIAHRGPAGTKLIMARGGTLGAVLTLDNGGAVVDPLQRKAVWDGSLPPSPEPSALHGHHEPFALAVTRADGFFLARDRLGVRPLYCGMADGKVSCFASEVKALLDVTKTICEFPPGSYYDPKRGFQSFGQTEPESDLEGDSEMIVASLIQLVREAVGRHAGSDPVGCLLTDDPGSSILAALLRPFVETLHTYAAGGPGTPTLDRARWLAQALDSEHHEVVVELDELVTILPEVIYHLESFDTAVVRAGLSGYLMSRLASQHVDQVFSSLGSVELLGGSVRGPAPEIRSPAAGANLAVKELHNTYLQQVDRCGAAHGLTVHLSFLEPTVVDYASRVPADHAVRQGEEAAGVPLLYKALDRVLAEADVAPEAAGAAVGDSIGDCLAVHADQQISGEELNQERDLPNGWILWDKEELMYFRLFREHFGEVDALDWMGRTRKQAEGLADAMGLAATPAQVLEEE